jgi:uncharacterized Zn-finger protein
MKKKRNNKSEDSDIKKAYSCSYKDCGKIFTESGNFKAHIRTHVSNFGKG